MKVSAIIPVFNGERFIAEALESVYKQSVVPEEIICIDDASTDGTFDLIRAKFPGVKVIRNDHNEGPSYSRNKGIEISTGDLIAFLDADDYWLPEKTRLQLNLLKEDPTLDIVAGLAEHFNDPKSTVTEEKISVSQPHFNAYTPSFLIRKSLFNKIGKFKESMRLSEDQDWIMRVREYGAKIGILNEVVLMIRIHENNTTKGLSFKESGMIDALKKSLDRRRNAGQLNNLKPII